MVQNPIGKHVHGPNESETWLQLALRALLSNVDKGPVYTTSEMLKNEGNHESFWICDVSFSCVYPVIDHEFRHNIVKVAVDPRDDSRVDPQTTLTML